ncbi:hypothetical protein, partial [Photobacterium carnosum]|uniref:hypothetical protein n=1 Tax=Photobacterium carnosum TaxID=2023717 RepID=UPI001C902F0A
HATLALFHTRPITCSMLVLLVKLSQQAVFTKGQVRAKQQQHSNGPGVICFSSQARTNYSWSIFINSIYSPAVETQSRAFTSI